MLESLFYKVAGLRLTKKETLMQVFFLWILKNNYFTEHLQANTSGISLKNTRKYYKEYHSLVKIKSPFFTKDNIFHIYFYGEQETYGCFHWNKLHLWKLATKINQEREILSLKEQFFTKIINFHIWLFENG